MSELRRAVITTEAAQARTPSPVPNERVAGPVRFNSWGMVCRARAWAPDSDTIVAETALMRDPAADTSEGVAANASGATLARNTSGTR
ncbi:hypothetical protein MPS_2463 [Mycobacterium pseudoshottsii JCM 15466]|nr:hypothetical protein A3649_01780 [Mycobacterium ulcerans]GAQ35160.1 hypothetical protein MPS_2463 [Mycobacterium pseudoshottsii JCM 15466]